MKKILFFALALTLICALMVSAQQPPAPPPPGPGGPGAPGGMMGNPMGGMMGMCPSMAVALPSALMIERGGDALGLTADRKAKVLNVLSTKDANIAKLRTAAQQASKALRDAVVAPTYDAAKVASLLAAAQKADADISSAQVKAWGELRAILTPAQVTQLSEMAGRRMSGSPGETRQTRDRTRQPRDRGGNPNAPANP